MKVPEAQPADALARLRRIEGRARGSRMIESGRECRDVVTQISATSKALEQIGSKLLAAGARYCITDEAAAAESGYDIDETAGSDRARRRGGDGARR